MLCLQRCCLRTALACLEPRANSCSIAQTPLVSVCFMRARHPHVDSHKAEPAAARLVVVLDRIASHAAASASGYGGELGGAAASFPEAAAASVLTRGVPFALAHPAPRRWLPLRKSAWAMAMRGRDLNRQQLARLVWTGGGAASHW